MTEPSYAELMAENQALKEAEAKTTLQGEDRPHPTRPSFFSRGVAGFKGLPWQSIVMLVSALAGVGAIGYFGGGTEAWGFKKLGHVASSIAYGIGGFIVAACALWTVNRVGWIRERATPAADDSRKSIEEWRKYREANPEAPWTEADARMSQSATQRYAASIIVFGIIMAAATLLAK